MKRPPAKQKSPHHPTTTAPPPGTVIPGGPVQGLGGGGGTPAPKHQGTPKHQHTSKKHASGGTAKHNPKPKRKLALTPSDVACCSAEALAASLRLQGYPVGFRDTLDLYFRITADPDEGATIEQTLEAAKKFGLAGARPVSYSPAGHVGAGVILGATLPKDTHALVASGDGLVWSWGSLYRMPKVEIEEAWEVNW